jgi:ABC-2 type transport system permease protein
MIRIATKLWAFIVRDFQQQVSYRLAFLLQIGGMFLSLGAFYFLTKMIDPNAKGLDGMNPFEWMLLGLAFQYYFSTALYAFSAKVRSEQMMGTLEAMLVSPTSTGLVIFSSAAWDFTYAGFRVLLYLGGAWLIFGINFHMESSPVLAVGVVLTLLSSVGLGMLSASFILYFKRGDPINFFLSGMTTLFGSVFFPVEQLPQALQGVSDYLPITWSLRVVRGAMLQGKGFVDLQSDLAALAILTVVLLPSGLYFSRIAIRKAKREGSLVQY